MFLARRKNSKRASTHLNYKRGVLTKKSGLPAANSRGDWREPEAQAVSMARRDMRLAKRQRRVFTQN